MQQIDADIKRIEEILQGDSDATAGPLLQCGLSLLAGLPQLSEGEIAALDCLLTLEELTAAVQQLSHGKAPGTDEIFTESLGSYWTRSGCCVVCFVSGYLPVSCQRAVLSLLPKKVIWPD